MADAHIAPSLGSRQREIPSLEPSRPCPRSRRKRNISPLRRRLPNLLLALLALITFLPLSNAVFINFEDCLDPTYRNAEDPRRLQFTPMHVWAHFNTSAPSHNLNVTVYGNVSGQSTLGEYPEWDSPKWNDPKDEFGKITDANKANNKLTTLFSSFKVLTYTAFNSEALQLCNFTVNTTCPITPAFRKNASDPYDLPGFTVAHDFYSSYSFSTWSSTMRIVSGDKSVTTLACVSANITPDLGKRLADALCYLPAAVLALVAIATVFAATCSPWGTSNIFRWTSNYGRDEDLIRLVTPGFGDCLQYIQFIVLAGSLNLNYPGYFQPVVSQASWSVLLFNESLASHGNGSHSLRDGVYFANGTYGISRLGQYVGMSEEQDIWPGMAVWLLGVIVIVTLLVQLGFAGRWIYHVLTNTQDTDLRGKNWSFTAGHVVRLALNYFMLPIISLSLFQLVVAARSPAAVVATAVILLVGVMGVTVWIFWFIFTTRPRAHLFDDLPTVLMYGPLYNTYSDDAAPFAFIPVLLTTIRGIAFGAIQPSGIAQLIILAICEVIFILTLHAFRPFQSNTSMNAYHTFFSAIRLVSTLLMIAFVPSLGVAEATKGWIGYAVLLMHATVLVFGFFLNSLQTLIEVGARLTGAGADQRGGLTKVVFGKRQLAKRHRHQRSSLNSNAAMLTHDADRKSIQLMAGRARSLSGSSAVLLNHPHGGTGSQRASVGFDHFSQGGDLSNNGNTSPATPGVNPTPWSYLGGGSGQTSRRSTLGTTLDNADPYYRPPRPRKQTMESMTPGMQDRRSGGSADLTNVPYADTPEQAETGDAGEGPSGWSPNRNTITPAYLRMHRDDSDPNIPEGQNNVDYAVRESDFYYGIRGPALSAQPTRKLKTGPADPMGPVSTATGWFKSLTMLGGKKKEKGKGFEVVRSTRVPPQMIPLAEDIESPPLSHEPYKDSPGTPPSANRPQKRESPNIAFGGDGAGDESDSDTSNDEPFDHHMHRVSDSAPALGPIDSGGGIELPSRIGSRVSHASQGRGPKRTPTIPRKSSRRTNSTDAAIFNSSSRLSTVLASPSESPGPHMPIPPNQHLHPNPGGLPIRLPFGSAEPSPSPERSPASSMFRPSASDLTALGPTDDLAPAQAISTGERPVNTGYVHQHVARDSIQNDGQDARMHLEASAEFVDRSRSTSTQHTLGSYRSH